MIFTAKNECIINDCHNKRKGRFYCSRHTEQIRVYGYIRKTSHDRNKISINDDIAKIEILDKNFKPKAIVIIDKEDVEKIKDFKWYISKGYVATKINKKTKKLHQILIGKKQGLMIDHINGNKLDNRKHNLRYVSNLQNTHNRHAKPRSISGMPGVLFYKPLKKWLAWAYLDGEYRHLGYYDFLDDAVDRRKEENERINRELELIK